MAYPFPTRTLSSTLQDHLDDHNTIATILGELPFTLTNTRDDHLNEHNALHPAFGLPTRAIGDSATFHLNDHGTIHANLIQTYAGIRGPWSQQLSTASVPGWPSSFTSSHSTFLSLQSAVNAAGTGRVFRITNSMTFTASLSPHTGDQFWADPGVLLTGTLLTVPAFTDGGAARPDVKIINAAFTGFRETILNTVATGWEIAYCDFTAENIAGQDGHGSIKRSPGTAVPGPDIHHNRFRNTANPINLYQSQNVTVRDCEFDTIGASGLSGPYKVATGASNITYSHCWTHGMNASSNSAGIWFDYHNYGCLVEWCLIEGNTYGIIYEANPGTVLGANDPTDGRPTARNTTRYNFIRNNAQSGIDIEKDSDNDIYGNYFYRNQTANQNAESMAELRMYTDSQQTTQLTVMRKNRVHNNYIEVQPTIVGQQPKRGGTLYIQAGALPPNPSEYSTNTADNQWLDNYYKLNRSLSSTDTFRWVDAAGNPINKSWAQWQALPQDATSGAEA